MGHPANTYALVADIGGTNTRVALAHGPKIVDGTIRRYENAAFGGLEAVLQQFLKDEGGVDTMAACVAVAGPVSDGCGRLTNLDWTIDESTLARATKAETVAIVNDLQAQGYALGRIDPKNMRSIIEAPEPDPTATKLVIGVGTGFNAAAVFETTNGRIVPPSECGHVNLPIKTADELQLSDYLALNHGIAAVEEVLSGRGVQQTHAFVLQQAGLTQTKSTREIIADCVDGQDAHAQATGVLFSTLFARVCGNLALTYLPFGGIYLVGGVARAFAPLLNNFGFTEEFRDKGRFSDFLGQFGVDVIEDDYAALTGSAAYLTNLQN